MRAFKLITTAAGESAFQEGTLALTTPIMASHFVAQTHVEEYEVHLHTAPRYQFVITLKGKLRFTVSNGSSFIIEPGIILIARDLTGHGHSWELLDGEEWHRIYIVPPPDAEDHFRINGDTAAID